MEEMRNEVMTTEEAIEGTEGATESSGLGTGLAMLIGCGLTLAAIAGGKKLKKVWTNHKAKKGQMEVINTEDIDEDAVEAEVVDSDETK